MMIRQREMEEQMRRQREESYSRMGYMDPVSQGWKNPTNVVTQVPASHVDPLEIKTLLNSILGPLKILFQFCCVCK